jgi:hypothetical protein
MARAADERKPLRARRCMRSSEAEMAAIGARIVALPDDQPTSP